MGKKSVDLSCFGIRSEWMRRGLEEKEDGFRNCFCRDRDRILYSKEFRRLSGKTQAFVAGFDDHFRTRLTHTLEVVQIATTISKSLGLNVDLTEAIALGHDVGHAPFGHKGEKFLNLMMNGCYELKGLNNKLPEHERGFKHNWQGLRVISTLERHDRAFRFGGINLTNFTRWGILHHTNTTYDECGYLLCSEEENGVKKKIYSCGYMQKGKPCPWEGRLSVDFYSQYSGQLDDDYDWSYEAFVVERADEIAQRHHDIEDAIEAGILKKEDLIAKVEKLFKKFLSDEDNALIQKIKNEDEKGYYMPLFRKFIINLLESRLVEKARTNLEKFKEQEQIKDYCDFMKIRNSLSSVEKRSKINYDDEFKKIDSEFKYYLYEIILNSYLAQRMDGKSDYLLRQITKAFVTNPHQLPDDTIITLFKNLNVRLENSNCSKEIKEKLNKYDISEDDLKKDSSGLLRITLNRLHKSQLKEYHYALLRTICDYIAGMTDQYAIEQYRMLYGLNSVW